MENDFKGALEQLDDSIEYVSKRVACIFSRQRR